MEITIRQEQPKDYAQVYQVVKNAFLNAEHTNGREQDLVEELRRCPEFVPQLSLVAVVDGNIVGHALFTQVQIGEETQLCLAPLAVAPTFQRMGVGKKLIEAGHKIARNLGYRCIILVGHETYYPRFGYQPAGKLGIQCPIPVPAENFMVCALTKDQPLPQGVVRFAPPLSEE